MSKAQKESETRKKELSPEELLVWVRNQSSRCPECGYRIRGKNHNEGDHHKNRKKK